MRFNRKTKFLLALIPLVVVAGALIWNYTEPWTSAYEINPVTLEIRSVEYLERPITGLAEFRVIGTEKMTIGIWLEDNGYLKENDETSGYWVLVKSYNPRHGFIKGEGRQLGRAFDQAGVLTPMPYPSITSENKHWVDWCTADPIRAKFFWATYSELVANPEHLHCASYMLGVAPHSGRHFLSVMRDETEDCLPKDHWRSYWRMRWELQRSPKVQPQLNSEDREQ